MTQTTLTVLLVLLIISPAFLMFASHLYGVRSQSHYQGYTVVLKEDTTPEIIDEHGRRRGVRIERIFDSKLPGYSAELSARAAERLRKDPGVRFIEKQESDEFSIRSSKYQRKNKFRFRSKRAGR